MTGAPTGTAVPARFNMARYCLDDRDSGRVGLIIAGPGGAAERWTFGALKDAVLRVAGGLRRAGLAPGDRLMIRMDNDVAYALAYFGAIAAGLVAMPSSPQLTANEAAFLLANSGARAIALGAEAGTVVVPDGIMAVPAAAIRAWAQDGPIGAFADTAADDPAYLIYTSGTTGRPKGVLHAQRSAWGRRPMYRGWYGIGPDDVVLHAGAFNWTYTLGAGLTDPWANGAIACLYQGPRAPGLWPELIERLGATLFATVPGVYRQILKYAPPSAGAMPSLRHGLSAGEALAPELLEAWRTATGRELYEALGMSEISTYVSQGPPGPARPGTPGRPQTGRRVAILPVDGPAVPLPAGETGLVAIHRSDPGLMLGYWQRPDEEAVVFRGDWFVGGDLAHQDDDGYLWFHGRADDIMNAGGYRVSPAEVEAVLADHPGVAEVAVAERRLSPTLSIVCAYVVARDPGLTKAALLDHAGDRLAAYKCPKEVVLVDSLPRTGNGKVMRRALHALG